MAKKKLADVEAAFIPMDRRYYISVSEKVMETLRNNADRFEQAGVDEAYLDVSDRSKGHFPVAREIALRVKEEVMAGERLTCSIGIGANKLVAKIAADYEKPNGLTVVEPDRAATFLRPMPVEALIGVGKKTAEKMKEMGIVTIGDLANAKPSELDRAFGERLGKYSYRSARGIDESPVQEREMMSSISRIATLSEDTRDLKAVLSRVDKLCDEVHERILRDNVVFRSVSAVAILKDLSVHTRSRTLDQPTDRIDVLKHETNELFARLLNASELEVRRVGVRVSELAEVERMGKRITDFASG